MDMVLTTLGGDLIEDKSCDLTPLSESKEGFNLSEEPKIVPRLGEEYQVALPELASQSKYHEKPRNEVKDEDANDFLRGLPLSVMWVQPGPDNDKNELAASKGKVSSVMNEKGSDSNGSFPVPGSSYKPLSKTEEDNFLLGLYIFGRDFMQVKNFIGSRSIGEILSHYYGKFYRSQWHQKWLRCKKTRSTKYACGRKIFTGSRQQELLSRLLQPLSEEGKNELLEVQPSLHFI